MGGVTTSMLDLIQESFLFLSQIFNIDHLLSEATRGAVVGGRFAVASGLEEGSTSSEFQRPGHVGSHDVYVVAFNFSVVQHRRLLSVHVVSSESGYV